jgi:hypothetical protein
MDRLEAIRLFSRRKQQLFQRRRAKPASALEAKLLLRTHEAVTETGQTF